LRVKTREHIDTALIVDAVAYEAGGLGGGRPPGLKNSGKTLFSGQTQVAQ